MSYKSKYTGEEVDMLLDKIAGDDVGDIDSALSTTSENPLMNKVITQELSKKVSRDNVATINGQSIIDGGNITIEGGEGGATPDWNAEEGEDGYIKNRTHYLEYLEAKFATDGDEQYVSLGTECYIIYEKNIKKMVLEEGKNQICFGPPTYLNVKIEQGRAIATLEDAYGLHLSNPIYLYSGCRTLNDVFIPDTIARKEDIDNSSPITEGEATGSALQTIEAETFTDKNENSSTYGSEVDAEASGDYSLALGGDAAATAKRAVAQGHRCIARGETSHAEGHCAVVEYTDETYNGYGSHAEGYSTLVDGVYSHAEGSKTIAHGSNAHAEGGSTIVSSDFAHTEGYGTYTGDRNNAPQFESPEGGESGGNGGGIVAPDVEGKKGVAAHAEGNFTIAEGNYSHAEGRQAKSLGEASHAEGNETIAEGNYSHSQGWVSHAIGGYSHAEGQNTRARGEASHSEGNNTDANGPHSHAEGVGTQTHSEVMGQHVEGHWNHITDGVMVVGCGTSNDDRKNAIDVKQGGRVFVKGVGGYEGTDIDGKKDLATVVNNISAKVYDASVKIIEVDVDVFYGLLDRDLSAEEFESVFGDTFKTINPNSVYYLKRTRGDFYDTLILLYIYTSINDSTFVFGYNFAGTELDAANGVSIIYYKDLSTYMITDMEV